MIPAKDPSIKHGFQEIPLSPSMSPDLNSPRYALKARDSSFAIYLFSQATKAFASKHLSYPEQTTYFSYNKKRNLHHPQLNHQNTKRMSTPVPAETQWVADYTIVLICKECKEYPANIVEDNSSGDTICGSCGLVLGERMIDTRPEWRTFAGDEDSGADLNRCGDVASSLLEGSQLETSIAFNTNSAAGRDISRAQKKTHKNTTNKKLLEAYSDINAYCQSMSLTLIVSEATKEYFKKAYESKAVKGKDNTAIIATCIFLACRHCNVARTFNEVMAITNCSKKELSRTFTILSKLFQNEEAAAHAAAGASTTQPQQNTARGGTAQSMIPRICSHLQLDHRTQQIALELTKELQRLESLGARGPSTVAGAVIYLVSHLNNNPKTIASISRVCGTAPRTLMHAYKVLYKQRAQLVNPEWVLGGIRSLPSS